MRFPFSALAVIFVAHGISSLLAQVPAKSPATPKNLVSNGSFESFFKRENLWAGVDSNGYLAGERGSVPVLTASGVISDTSMPVSVSLADLNGDKLLDIAAMDVLGYLRIYFNGGTPQQPKFSVGELAAIFLSRIRPDDPSLVGVNLPYIRRVQRIHMGDITKSGKKDLLIGNYLGEILLIPNAGSLQTPDFKQPQDVSQTVIPTMKDSTKRWGNVFSPCLWDWNRDGRDDMLLGEGSYSANNIHLLINQGGSARPIFDESNRFALAYGDGLEQLTPCVVDYNGDAQPDLLVAERSGKVAVYLNGGAPWKRGEPPPELPFASFINPAGGSSPLSFGSICTISTGDLNGDGLFDLVVGKTNGRIALVLNNGTRTEPKFSAPVEIKAEAGTPPMAIPSGWDLDYGLHRGNFYAQVSVVKAEADEKAQPPDGQACLKVSYMPSPNKVMAAPSFYTPSFPGFVVKGPNFSWGSEETMRAAPARYFMVRQLGRFKLNVNATYTLSFKIKGGKINDGQVFIGWAGYKKLSETRVTRGERDSAVVQRNEAREEQFDGTKFSVSPQWSEVKKEFKVAFKNRDLADIKEASSVLDISFSIPPGGGDVYLDDVRVVEKNTR